MNFLIIAMFALVFFPLLSSLSMILNCTFIPKAYLVKFTILVFFTYFFYEPTTAVKYREENYTMKCFHSCGQHPCKFIGKKETLTGLVWHTNVTAVPLLRCHVSCSRSLNKVETNIQCGII